MIQSFIYTLDRFKIIKEFNTKNSTIQELKELSIVHNTNKEEDLNGSNITTTIR